MSLPLIDLRAAEVSRVRRACEEHGFFYVSHHGVDEALQAQLERASRDFFARPLEEKQQVAMARGGRAWRGWFPLGGELTSGAPDLKEGYYFGDELRPGDARPMHGPNLFPPGELREVVLAYVEAQRALGQRLMSVLAQSLELPADFFSSALTREPLSLFRIFHYPAPRDAQESGGWGVGEHTDYGLLTILKQDDCGGLEVKTPSGWVDAPPIPGTFVCNLGDMLDRMTGGRYRSTPHRVRNTSGRSRFSWPYFFDPSFDAEVKPLPGALVRPATQDAAERWDRASVHELRGTYGDYLLSKVSKVFPQLASSEL